VLISVNADERSRLRTADAVFRFNGFIVRDDPRRPG
jgi:hypothetical protein